MKIQTEPLLRHRDERGDLVKVWTAPVGGEVYAVELRPGTSRGHHFHRRGGEWFVPLVGHCTLVVEDPVTRTRVSVRLEGVRARVEPGQAHALFAADTPAWVIAIADCVDDETIPYPLAAP